MKNVKLFTTIFLVVMILSNVIFTVMGISEGNGDLRRVVASLDLPEVAILDAQVEEPLKLGVFKMLFVDGGWLQVQRDNMMATHEIKDAIINSVPVIVFGGDTNLLYDLADETMRETTNQPTIAHGVYFDGSKNNFLFVEGRSTKESTVKDVYNWATKKLQDTQPSSSQEISTSSDPDAIWYAIPEFTYYFAWELYGKLNLIRRWFKLKYDQSSTYDWYSLIMTTQSVPGHIAYDSDWRTADIWNWIDADYYGDPNKLIVYGPYQTIGQEQVTYTIGVAAGEQGAAVTASMSRTYVVKDIEVYDESDFSLQLAKWWHNVNEQKDAGYYTCTIDPGVTIRTPPTVAYTESFYQVQYMQPNWFWGWIIPDIWKSPEIYITTEVDYNFPPDTPLTPAGPTSGVKYTSYTYSTSTTDPDGDNVRYQFDWKDGTTTWTGWYSSGTTVFASHSWSSSGTYSITVRAQDIDGAYSSWSMVLAVNIVNSPPYTPSTPSGPTSGYTYSTYTYSTSTTDPDGDSVRYQFNWGDGTSTWTGWYASGVTASASHYWSSIGTYYVKVRAQDSDSAYSGWSSSLMVSISSGGGGGCPILSVYDGTEFALEGLLDIYNPDGIDVVASHVLIHTPEPVEQRYLLRLTEHPQTYSHIDQVQLFATLTNGTEVKLPLVSAIHSEDGNVKQKLLLSDDVRAVMLGADHNNGTSQYIDLKFVAPDELEIQQFTFIIEGHNRPLKIPY